MLLLRRSGCDQPPLIPRRLPTLIGPEKENCFFRIATRPEAG